MPFQLRRGTDAERTQGGGVVFAEGELIYVTDTEEVYVGDGVTPGGLRVTGNVAGSPANLTQDLNLNGYSISGNGTISATAFVGDGSQLTGIVGIVDGQEYSINVQGDVRGADSNIIVDSLNGVVNATFVGDGSSISNISLNQLINVSIGVPVDGQVLQYIGGQWVNGTASGGIVEGMEYAIDIVGNVKAPDSTVVLNSLTNTALLETVNLPNNRITFTRPTGIPEINFEAFQSYPVTNMLTVDDAGSLAAYNGLHGVIQFGKRDSVQTTIEGTIKGSTNDLRIGHDSVTLDVSDETKYFTLRNGNFGVGTFAPQKRLEIKNGSILFNETAEPADIVTPIVGEVMFSNVEESLMWRGATNWYKAVGTKYDTLQTILDAGITLGLNSQLELDALLEDSTLATGTIAYNEDIHRFQFFQAGSWVNLPNNGDYTGQILQWDGVQGEWAATTWQTPETGQVLKWDGTRWAPGSDVSGGGLGGGSFTNIGIGADDSSIRLINEGESVLILGGVGITTSSDPEGNITINGFDGTFASLTGTPTTLAGYGITDAFDGTFASLTGTPTTLAGYGITDAFDGTFASLTGTPTTLAGYGITDAATSAQGALADSALQPADFGNFTIVGSVLDTSDSSGITITPALTVQSDLNVDNDLRVNNVVYADRFESTTTGTPEIEAATNLNLTAGNAVVITSSPLRMATFTTTERDALAAQNGDMIYNSTTNKFQGYANGIWVDLH